MNIIVRLLVAIVGGALVTAVLNYFGLLNGTINGLIGFIVAVLVFINYDGVLPWRRV